MEKNCGNFGNIKRVRRDLFQTIDSWGKFFNGHIDNDLGGSCNTKNWVKCAELFSKWVNAISDEIGRPLPVTLT